MQKFSYPFYRSFLSLFDWLSLIIIYFLCDEIFPSIQGFKQEAYILLFFVFNFSWITSVYIVALYSHTKWFEFITLTKRTGKALILTVIFILIFLFAYKYPYSRMFIFLNIFIFSCILIISRFIIYFVLLATRNSIEKRIAIIGDNEAALKLIQYFGGAASPVQVRACFMDERNTPDIQLSAISNIRQKEWTEKVSSHSIPAIHYGSVLTNHGAIRKAYGDERFFSRNTINPPLFKGAINDCLLFSITNKISEIYCTISPESRPELYELARQAEKHFIPVKFIPDYANFIRKAFVVDYVEELPVLSLRPLPLDNPSNRFLKRALDVVVSLFVIVCILSWLLPLLALCIKVESRGPVFFTQLRSGKNNKSFRCIKFRSLRQDNILESKQVTRNDDRVTRIGRFLRKSNLDELPQFFNVLSGEMSVVGPRPHMLKHTLEFDALHQEYMVRHFVKPGVTGLAQINGFRGEIRTPELLRKRVEYDIYYLEHWSLWEDIRIILATIFVSLRGDKNAY